MSDSALNDLMLDELIPQICVDKDAESKAFATEIIANEKRTT